MVKRLLFLLVFPVSVAAMGQDTTRLSLLFLGDIMQHDSQIAAAYDPVTGTYDYSECFEHVKPVFESADLTIGNLELTLGGAPYKGYPNFSAPDELVHTLIKSGVDVLVTANNHCLDRGKKGLQRTIAVLDTLQVPHTGTFVDSAHRARTYPLLLEKKGVRISLLNYTYGTNGIPVTKPNIVNYIDTLQMAMDIEKAKAQNSDLMIVFIHWGDEYQRLPNKSQKKVADFCFRRGVKLVIGAHPHVLQPLEWHEEKDQLVAYSLGNFVSGQTSRYKNGGTMLYVDLLKVKADTISTTHIEDASYKLQFVYRDAQRNFRILPLPEFENDTIVVRGPAGRAMLTEFASDSRALFDKYNMSIGEDQRHIQDSVFYIAIHQLDSTLSQSLPSPDSLAAGNPIFRFYGVRSERIEGVDVLASGEFFDREVAEEALANFRATFPSGKAVLVRRKKGR